MSFLRNIRLPTWVIGLLAFIIILRVPSVLEPYFYGDEMIYLSLGQGVRQGLSLYKEIHDNKPPLLYLTAAIAGNIFWFKILLAAVNLLSIVLFYKLSVHFFQKNVKAQKISTILFAIFTTIPLLEGNIVNAELFMIAFSLGGLLILLKNKLNFKHVYLAGVLFGIGTLFKVPAMFDMPVIIVFWLIMEGFSDWKSLLKKSLFLTAGFATPILITFIWYFFRGALTEYIRAVFMQNVGYLSSFRPGDIQKPFYIKNAPLIIRAVILFAGLVLLYMKRSKLSKNFILYTIWLLFGLFAVALSERPYPHYYIQVVAPISLLLTILFAEKSIEQSLVVFPLALAFFVPFYYKFYHYPTLSYYSRFVSFGVGKIDKGGYLQSFAPTVKRNYELAEFLLSSSKPSDRVFMWDPDSATVYALSRRLPPIKYVADYHVNDYSSRASVAESLAKEPPKFILITSGHPFPEIEPLIKSRYLLISQVQNTNIYSRKDYQVTP